MDCNASKTLLVNLFAAPDTLGAAVARRMVKLIASRTMRTQQGVLVTLCTAGMALTEDPEMRSAVADVADVIEKERERIEREEGKRLTHKDK